MELEPGARKKSGPLNSEQGRLCQLFGKAVWSFIGLASKKWGKTGNLVAKRCKIKPAGSRVSMAWNLWQPKCFRENPPDDNGAVSRINISILYAYFSITETLQQQRARCARAYHAVFNPLDEDSTEYKQQMADLVAWQDEHKSKEATDIIAKGGRWKVMRRAELEITEMVRISDRNKCLTTVHRATLILALVKQGAEIAACYNVHVFGCIASSAVGDPKARAVSVLFGLDDKV